MDKKEKKQSQRWYIPIGKKLMTPENNKLQTCRIHKRGLLAVLSQQNRMTAANTTDIKVPS